MKFATQHKRHKFRTNKGDSIGVCHRDGKQTWVTTGESITSNNITHATVRDAKAWMNNPSLS